MKNKILSLAFLAASAISLSGCANNTTPSHIDGAFGISLHQYAGNLKVNGYNSKLTLLTVIPPSPSSQFQNYSVNVSPTDKTVSRISAIESIGNQSQCIEKKQQLFNEYTQKYQGQYRNAWNTDGHEDYIDFDNATITFFCDQDLFMNISSK